MELDYEGDLEPIDCWELLKKDDNAHLIDCRTKQNGNLLGIRLTSIKKCSLVEWQLYPSMALMKNSMKILKMLTYRVIANFNFM